MLSTTTILDCLLKEDTKFSWLHLTTLYVGFSFKSVLLKSICCHPLTSLMYSLQILTVIPQLWVTDCQSNTGLKSVNLTVHNSLGLFSFKVIWAHYDWLKLNFYNDIDKATALVHWPQYRLIPSLLNKVSIGANSYFSFILKKLYFGCLVQSSVKSACTVYLISNFLGLYLFCFHAYFYFVPLVTHTHHKRHVEIEQ